MTYFPRFVEQVEGVPFWVDVVVRPNEEICVYPQPLHGLNLVRQDEIQT